MEIKFQLRSGLGRQKCIHCPAFSLRGHYKGQGLCRYHWAAYCGSAAWANELEASPDWAAGAQRKFKAAR